MTKFKLLLKLKKGRLNTIKCIRSIRTYLMDKQEARTSAEPASGTKRKIKAHKKTGDKKAKLQLEDITDTSSEEGFIPLAARDSKWVDLAFYNPNFQSQQEEDDLDEEELQIVDVEGNLKAPILILFPGLNESSDSSSILANLGSTSDVTKMLVGQKPDFSRMRSSRKLLPTDNKLTSVPEMPQEETESLDGSLLSYLPSNSAQSRRSIAGSDATNENNDSEDEVGKRATHTKRRKKRSDVRAIEYDSSSSMVTALRTRPPSKPRLRGNSTMLRKGSSHVFENSSHGSLGDDERT